MSNVPPNTPPPNNTGAGNAPPPPNVGTGNATTPPNANAPTQGGAAPAPQQPSYRYPQDAIDIVRNLPVNNPDGSPNTSVLSVVDDVRRSINNFLRAKPIIGARSQGADPLLFVTDNTGGSTDAVKVKEPRSATEDKENLANAIEVITKLSDEARSGILQALPEIQPPAQAQPAITPPPVVTPPPSATPPPTQAVPAQGGATPAQTPGTAQPARAPRIPWYRIDLRARNGLVGGLNLSKNAAVGGWKLSIKVVVGGWNLLDKATDYIDPGNPKFFLK
ncbi:hypothetical protein KKC44_02200 [Patescibacteria group bacterium]|nr:hypothetical protein [Patescibacteria group bacterium]MBU2259395.1 hypothetical protein [Patescibacteria group bacterium]